MKSAIFQLHAAVLLWGFTGVLGRAIDLSEGVLVWYRMLIVTVVLFFVLLIRKEFREAQPRKALPIIRVGLLRMAHWLLFYAAIKYSNVSIALVSASAGALITAFMEPLLMKKKFAPAEFLLSLLAISGILLIYHYDAQHSLGMMLGLLSTFFGAILTIFNKQLLEKHSAPVVIFYELGTGLLCLTLLMPVYLYFLPTNKLLPTFTDFSYLMVLSVLCTVFTFLMAFRALKQVSPFTLNLTMNMEPVYGILFAFLFFAENEMLHPSFYAGFGLIFLSVALQTLRSFRPAGKLPYAPAA